MHGSDGGGNAGIFGGQKSPRSEPIQADKAAKQVPGRTHGTGEGGKANGRAGSVRSEVRVLFI